MNAKLGRLGAAVLSMALITAPATSGAAEGGPLACEKPHINIGETRNQQQSHKFELRNVSKENVEITATHKACGCVKREFSKYTLAPGETSELTLEFPIRNRPGSLGDFTERMEIYVNNQHESPALVVSVFGRLTPIAYRLRDGIHIEAPPAGKPFRGQIELFLNKAHGVKIEAIEPQGPLVFEARIARREDALAEGEEKAVLEVSGVAPKGVELPAVGSVLVKLNDAEMPEMSVPVTLYRKRSHEVRLSPQPLAFGVHQPGATVKKFVTVQLPKEPGYALEKTEPTGEGVKISVEENPKTPHIALLRCELDTSSVAGSVNQDLLITIAAPGGQSEVYKLPISGYVKPAEKAQASSE